MSREASVFGVRQPRLEHCDPVIMPQAHARQRDTMASAKAANAKASPIAM
jgi:hypothetical protein